MRYSKANLAVMHVASRDPVDAELGQVHLARDGSSVAANGWALMAVSPPKKASTKKFPDVGEPQARPPESGVGVPTKTVASALKNLPTDKRPQLQFVQMTQCSPTRVELMTTDGDRTAKVGARPVIGRFPKWRSILTKARERKVKARICIDRQRLVALLQAIDKAAPDPGDLNPTYIEIGGENEPIYVRAENSETRQRVVGIVTPIDTQGKWIKTSKWEKRMVVEEEDGGIREVEE